MYITNKKLYYEIIVSKGRGTLTRKAQKMLELIANRTINKKPYYNPDDKFDCLQSGLLDLFSNWYHFDENKSRNAFAYFTEIFKRGMMKGFNKLNKKKGANSEDITMFSLDSSNDGLGMHNI